MRRPARHTDAGLLALTVIWGVNFSVIKAALDVIPPFAFNALRFPLACVVLWALLRSRGSVLLPRPDDRLRVVVLGVVGNVVYQFFFILGMDLTTAGNGSLLLATTPVWTLMLSVVLGHERPGAWVWAGIVGTVVGMTLVVIGGPGVDLGGSRLVGDLLMVGAAVVWSVYTVGSRDLVRRYGSLAVTAWTLWIGTVGLVLIGVPQITTLDLASVPAPAWGGVVYAGVLAVGVAYALWYRGVQHLGNSRTAAYSNLVPVVALAVAWAWLGEVPSLLQLAGAAVILGGLSTARFARDRAPDAGRSP